MQRPVSLVLALVGLSLLFTSPSVADPKIGFHLDSTIAKNTLGCLPPSQGGIAPTTLSCTQYQTSGELNRGYTLYLVSDQDNIRGLSFGLDYLGADVGGAGLFSWTPCADIDFPSATWPESGSGMRLTWANCQVSKAIAGFFYVYAYGDDAISIVENPIPASGPELLFADCDGAERLVQITDAGTVRFSETGVLPGCNPCLGNCEFPVELCTVSPAMHDFGTVFLGFPVTQSFTYKNSGQVSFSGNPFLTCPGVFQITSGGGFFTVAPGDSHVVEVTFNPSIEASWNCALQISGAFCPPVPLMGSGSSACELTPETINAGTVVVGEVASVSFSIKNTTSAPFGGDVTSPCPDFAVVSGGGPFTLNPGDSVEVVVEFSPSTVGNQVCMIENGTTCPNVTISGVGVSTPCLITPQSVEVTSPVGVAETVSFVVENLSVSPVSGSVSASCADFTITGGGGAFTLAPGQTRQVDLEYLPSSLTSEVCLVDLGTSCDPVSVTGTPTSPCVVASGTVDFGEVALGDNELQTITVTNLSASNVTGTFSFESPCPDFMIVSGEGAVSIPPNGTHEIIVKFEPSQIGNQSCNLVSSGLCEISVALEGTGGYPCTMDPVFANFGTILVGSFAEQGFVITNNSSQVLSGLFTVPCGGFSIESGASYSLNPGESHVVVVRFTPTAASSYGCQLVSDCADVPLSGSGTFNTPGGSQANAKLAFHITPKSAKAGSICTTDAPTDVPCSQFVTHGSTQVSYDVYLLAANLEVPAGLRGIELGIDYNGAEGSGIDIFGWSLCADLEFPSGVWPTVAGVGNVITWATCQDDLVPGFETEGAQAIAGSFYVYAYSPDVLSMIPRPTPNPDIGVADCASQQTSIPFQQRGTAAFNASGQEGCNPCLAPCVSTSVCTLTPGFIDFGGVSVGSTSDRVVTLTNTSNTVLSGNITLSGSDCEHFEIIAGGGPYNLAPQSSQVITVRFAPTETGTQNCTLEASNCSSVGLTGGSTGPQVLCSVSPSLVDFGELESGLSATETVTITNVGNQTFFGTASIQCADSQFSIISGGGSYLLGVGASHDVEVQFTSNGTLGDFSCTLDFDSVCSPVMMVVDVGGSAVPARLLSSEATRTQGGARFAWTVAEDDGLGQRVYLEHADGTRTPRSDWLFGEDGVYVFHDQEAPYTRATYWVGANGRDGSLEWLGKVELSAFEGRILPLVAYQNRPNPFRSATQLSFRANEEGWAEIQVYDMNGREVGRPLAQHVSPGSYNVTWNGVDASGQPLSSGVYLYRVSVGGESVTKKMLFLRE